MAPPAALGALVRTARGCRRELGRQPKREGLLPQVVQPGHHRGAGALGEVQEHERSVGSAWHAWWAKELRGAQAVEAKHCGARVLVRCPARVGTVRRLYTVRRLQERRGPLLRSILHQRLGNELADSYGLSGAVLLWRPELADSWALCGAVPPCRPEQGGQARAHICGAWFATRATGEVAGRYPADDGDQTQSSVRKVRHRPISRAAARRFPGFFCQRVPRALLASLRYV